MSFEGGLELDGARVSGFFKLQKIRTLRKTFFILILKSLDINTLFECYCGIIPPYGT